VWLGARAVFAPWLLGRAASLALLVTLKTPDRISERPPRGGLSFCADHVAAHESVFGT
jgi:hypothetical protein